MNHKNKTKEDLSRFFKEFGKDQKIVNDLKSAKTFGQYVKKICEYGKLHHFDFDEIEVKELLKESAKKAGKDLSDDDLLKLMAGITEWSMIDDSLTC